MRTPDTYEAPIRVLVVDDQEEVARAIQRTLSRDGFDVVAVHTGEGGLAYVTEHTDELDVVLLDLDMPGMNGLEVLARIRQLRCACQVVIWTVDGKAQTATQALHAGAFTYMTKPIVDVDAFIATVRSAAGYTALKRHARALEAQIERVDSGRLLGESLPMHALRSRMQRLAKADVTVLIHGESGTGKELIARSIHDHSARARGPFVALNCGAVAETLIDSELFGHVRGAFTGALASRLGMFAEADGGTLFLDEIAELPLPIQIRLLRVLQEREVRPVGADGVRRIDVRVVAATHVDLQEHVEAQRFRADLYHRLNVAAIEVPPLRARMSDLPLLVSHLLRKHSGRTVHLTPKALSALTDYAWPGNVRELENALLHALALTAGDTIDETSLPPSLRARENQILGLEPHNVPDDLAWTASLSLAEAKKRVVDDFERRFVTKALADANGNLTHAARQVGLDRANFRRTLRRLGIDVSGFRE